MTTLQVKEVALEVADTPSKANIQVANFIGQIFSYNNSLKLTHWYITGVGSYSKHIALDQAIGALLAVTDRIVETSYALLGDLEISIPATERPKDIIKDSESFYKTVELNRRLFNEFFTQSVIDDYQEAIQQLLFRLKRLE